MRADRTTKITIQKNTRKRNSYGEVLDLWEDVVITFASKEPLLGREYFSAETVQSKVELKFRTHYIEGIKNNMRIVDGFGIYKILSVINYKNQNRELLFYAREYEQDELEGDSIG